MWVKLSNNIVAQAEYRDCECGGITTLHGIRGYGPYSDEGGGANKEKGQNTFLDQFSFIFISIKVESEEKGVARLKPFVLTNVEPPKAKVETSTSFKGKFDSQPKCTRDVKCFRCNILISGIKQQSHVNCYTV